MSKVTAEDLKLWRVEAQVRELAVGAFATLSAAVGMYREAQALPGAVPHPVMARLCLAVDAHAAALRGLVDVPPVPPAVTPDVLNFAGLERLLRKTRGEAASGFSRAQLEVVAEELAVDDWSTLSHGQLAEGVAALFAGAAHDPRPVVTPVKTFKLKKR
jgi:hypothetical protein